MSDSCNPVDTRLLCQWVQCCHLPAPTALVFSQHIEDTTTSLQACSSRSSLQGTFNLRNFQDSKAILAVVPPVSRAWPPNSRKEHSTGKKKKNLAQYTPACWVTSWLKTGSCAGSFPDKPPLHYNQFHSKLQTQSPRKCSLVLEETQIVHLN